MHPISNDYRILQVLLFAFFLLLFILLGGAIGVDVLMVVSLVSSLYDALCGSANVLRGSPTWLSVASVVVIVLLLPSLVVSSLFLLFLVMLLLILVMGDCYLRRDILRFG